ncbi:hypothetical protein LguiA_030822 [Lonicera macranthoides]
MLVVGTSFMFITDHLSRICLVTLLGMINVNEHPYYQERIGNFSMADLANNSL